MARHNGLKRTLAAREKHVRQLKKVLDDRMEKKDKDRKHWVKAGIDAHRVEREKLALVHKAHRAMHIARRKAHHDRNRERNQWHHARH